MPYVKKTSGNMANYSITGLIFVGKHDIYMKTKVLRYISIVVCTFSIALLASCGSTGEKTTTSDSTAKAMMAMAEEKCNTDEVTFNSEAIIQLDTFFKDSADIHNHSHLFDSCYKYGIGNDAIDNTPLGINMAAVAQLYKIAAALTKPTNKQNFITGIRMYPGLDKESKAVTWFFQPILMGNDASSPHGNLAFDVVAEGATFTYDVKGIMFTKSDTSDLLETYRDSVRIKRGTSYGNFNPGNAWNSDTRSLIFPFQELFKLYDDYYGPGEPGKWYCQYIYFYNCGEIAHGSGNQTEVKHSVFISCLSDDNISTQGQSDTVGGKKIMRANLANMCPPNCAVINYPIH